VGEGSAGSNGFIDLFVIHDRYTHVSINPSQPPFAKGRGLLWKVFPPLKKGGRGDLMPVMNYEKLNK
jgi:hypothetical protein